MQGRSLWPLLTGKTSHHKANVFCEYFDAMCWGDTPGGKTTMLRSATHKVTVAHGEQGGELYDLIQDPNETRNQWKNPDYAEIKMELLCQLVDRLADTVDPLPPRRAEW